MVELLQSPTNTHTLGQMSYSNLEGDVIKHLFIFDQLWKEAIPAEEVIKELDTFADETNITKISGRENVVQAAISLTCKASTYVDAYVSPERLRFGLGTEGVKMLIDELTNGRSRGVHVRVLTEVRSENLSSAKNLLEKGVEIRHVPNLRGGFTLSEKEFMALVVSEGAQDPVAVLSTYPDLIDQHKSIFNTLWNIAVPATQRIREIKEGQEKEIRNN